METLSVSELSERLRRAGVKATYASMLAHGKRVPSLDLAVKIEEATGIPPSFWIERPDLSHGDAVEPTGIDGAFSGGVA